MTNIGVNFDGVSSHELGLVMTNKEISSPEPKTKMVTIPARNGNIDMSQVVSKTIKYKDRTIKMTFYTNKKVNEWELELSRLRNRIAGRRMKIIFDDDIAFYWLGRVTEVALNVSGRIAYINITATVDPFKYDIQSSMEDWLWDPFDFEEGIINEFSNLVVDGKLSVDIIGSKKYVNPIIISDAAMEVTYEGLTYPIATGSQVMYDIVLTQEVDTLIFTGNGTISINYTGGSL